MVHRGHHGEENKAEVPMPEERHGPMIGWNTNTRMYRRFLGRDGQKRQDARHAHAQEARNTMLHVLTGGPSHSPNARTPVPQLTHQRQESATVPRDRLRQTSVTLNNSKMPTRIQETGHPRNEFD